MLGETKPEDIFADTCVLLNFVQREWEHDRSRALVESDAVEIVVSQTVLDELSDVSDRRRDIYEDIIDFLLESESGIEEYDPSNRRVYIGDNDAKHVRRLQEQLAALEDQREALRRVRRFIRAAGRRVEYLESSLAAAAVDPVPPLELRFAIDHVLNHEADTKVVTDAAAWTADSGSGILVTLDGEDLLDKAERIVEVIVDEQSPEWAVDIVPPDAVVSDTQLAEEAE